MGLSIVECGNLAEYLTRAAAEESTKDYLYLNKFNNSMIFSDNGTKALLSDPVTAPYQTIYIKAAASGTGTGESAENACTLDTAKMITPKNAHIAWNFVGTGFPVAGFDIKGYGDLAVTFGSGFDGKITAIVDSKVVINSDVTIDSIVDSTVTTTGTATLTIGTIDRSNVNAYDIEKASTTLAITNGSSVVASNSSALAISADKNSHVVIGDLSTDTTNSTALTASLGSTITYILDANGDSSKITKTETLLGKVITVTEEADTSSLVDYIASSLTEEPEEP